VLVWLGFEEVTCRLDVTILLLVPRLLLTRASASLLSPSTPKRIHSTYTHAFSPFSCGLTGNTPYCDLLLSPSLVQNRGITHTTEVDSRPQGVLSRHHPTQRLPNGFDILHHRGITIDIFDISSQPNSHHS